MILVEPSSKNKRLALAQALRNPVAENGALRNDVKSQLRELRTTALKKMEDSIALLESAMSRGGAFQLFSAATDKKAIEIISGICGKTRAIAVNKSAVLSAELKTGLVSAGFHIIDTYRTAPETFHSDPPREPALARFTESWQLPQIPFSTVNSGFGISTGLHQQRERHTRAEGARDIVGLIGINAVSAQNGSVFLLQHRRNISRIVEQCRAIILVAGIDRVIPCEYEALFQTECTAWFGAEAIPLTLGSYPTVNAMEHYPLIIPHEEIGKNIYLILLNNNRRSILNGEYADVLSCIGCRSCIRHCPASRFFPGSDEFPLSPRELLFRNLLKGGLTLNRCIQCGNCQLDCPLDIDLPGMILRRRNTQLRARISFSDFFLSHAEEVEKLGSLFAPVINALFGMPKIKKAAELLGGMSSRRKMPAFAIESFQCMYQNSRTGHERKGGLL